MATPITPSAGGRTLSLTPGARVLRTPLSDETIWKRLKEAGFDEESIKRRDKAALIAYIAKLEAEIFDLQHNMGLLILERKELASKHDQIKASAEVAELAYKRGQAAHLSALAEAKKREESLKKSLRVEKECISSIEKALHEMRAESAETKVAGESKLAEARSVMEDAQKKSLDAEAKLHTAEALQAEASRLHRAAERKLQEFEAREIDLTRRIIAFKNDCDAKEKEISLERQTLSERWEVLQQEHKRLLDGKALLNQREDYIASKTQELNRLEKELKASKADVEKQLKALNDEKFNLELSVVSLSQKEEAVVEREALVNKREQELLVLQGKLASKESAEIQKVVANHEAVLRTRKLEFEAELEMDRKSVDDELEAKRRAWELREVDLSQREDMLAGREHDLGVQLSALADMEKDVAEKMSSLEDKERSLSAAEKEVELTRALLQQEKEEVKRMKLDLQKSLDSLDEKKKQVDYAKEKLETMKSETNELSALELKLKEEVDILRAQKLENMAEEERLRAEKAKFEAEWEIIDEKREELRKEAECVAEERQAVTRLLKDKRDSLRLEKEAMREQHRLDVESLGREREEFMNKMVQERSEWFSKIQKEHADFMLGLEMQKRELENSIEKRREEVESYLRDKENALELEKSNELQHISSLREKTEKELEHVVVEMKKLEAERMEIKLDREQRDSEWAVLGKSIEELRVQTQKLEEQRGLLHAEREEICTQLEQLQKLEELKLALDNMEVVKMQQSNMESNLQKISALMASKKQNTVQDSSMVLRKKVHVASNGNGISSASTQKPDGASPTSSAQVSWIKRCTELIFKNSPEKSAQKIVEKSTRFEHEDSSLASPGNLVPSNGNHGSKFKSIESFGKRQPVRYALGEPKVIREVPPEVEITKDTTDVESEIREDTNGKIIHPLSEPAPQVGRKRANSSSDGDLQAPERQNSKKRKQQDAAASSV